MKRIAAVLILALTLPGCASAPTAAELDSWEAFSQAVIEDLKDFYEQRDADGRYAGESVLSETSATNRLGLLEDNYMSLRAARARRSGQ